MKVLMILMFDDIGFIFKVKDLSDLIVMVVYLIIIDLRAISSRKMS
jgi:hypothetical protein